MWKIYELIKLSKSSLKLLQETITGDIKTTPYRTGPQLVELFNEFGFWDVYEDGFPSRWYYVKEKLDNLNGSNELKRLIEAIADPREYILKEENVEDAVELINSFLIYDGYRLQKQGLRYIVIEESEKEIQKAKPMRKSSKGGRIADPTIAKKKEKLQRDYYHLRTTEGYNKPKAIEILEKQYPWKKSTIEKYLK